jgi:hypothetical protein
VRTDHTQGAAFAESRPWSGSLIHGVAPLAPGSLVAQVIGGGITVRPKDGRTVLFGRQADDVHVCVGADDLGVSRQQGVLQCEGGRWSVRNLGRRPVRLPSGPLHTNAEPVPLAPGYTPLFVSGAGDREHLLELYVAGSGDEQPRPRPDDVTHQPMVWPLDPRELLVMIVLGQRYLRHEPQPQPLARKAAERQLVELDPATGWTYKKVEHCAKDVRARLAKDGVPGMTAAEVPEPVGNQLNDNLIRELMRSGTIVPTDLARLDAWADEEPG